MDNIFKTQEEINILLTTLKMFNFSYVQVKQHGVYYLYIYSKDFSENLKIFLNMNNYDIFIFRTDQCVVKYILEG